jgi:hypothetical protein
VIPRPYATERECIAQGRSIQIRGIITTDCLKTYRQCPSSGPCLR